MLQHVVDLLLRWAGRAGADRIDLLLLVLHPGARQSSVHSGVLSGRLLSLHGQIRALGR